MLGVKGKGKVSGFRYQGSGKIKGRVKGKGQGKLGFYPESLDIKHNAVYLNGVI